MAAAAVPDAAQDGLDIAEESSGAEQLPASKDDHPGAAPETLTVAAADHGVLVSETAQATESGPGKGAIVADVASDGRAGGDAAEDATATGDEHAAEQATLRADNAGEHGKP